YDNNTGYRNQERLFLRVIVRVSVQERGNLSEGNIRRYRNSCFFEEYICFGQDLGSILQYRGNRSNISCRRDPELPPMGFPEANLKERKDFQEAWPRGCQKGGDFGGLLKPRVFAGLPCQWHKSPRGEP